MNDLKRLYQRVSKDAEISKQACNNLGFDWKNWTDKDENNDDFLEKYKDNIKKRASYIDPAIDNITIRELSDIFFTEVFWNRYKKIYQFHPNFIHYLATTELGEIHKEIIEKLPFKSFYISFDGAVLTEDYLKQPSGDYVPATGMFIHVYIDKNDWISFSIVVTAEGNAGQPCYIAFQDGDSFDYVRDFRKFDPEMKKLAGITDQNIDSIMERESYKDPFYKLAINACEYLCASNAEIRDIKIPKKDRPVVQGKNQKPKPVNVQVSQVGYRLGEKFEKMYSYLEAESKRTGVKGIKRRPHVRRAHWHHYWTGPGRTILEVRWLEPVFVMGSDEEIDTVIHDVKGE